MTADLERRLAQRTRSAVTGALNRASRTTRPRRPADVDWDRTIRANLAHYLPEYRTVVPERLIGYARKQQVVARDVVLCLDQSGSMASSVVHAGVLGAVLASIRSLRTSVVAYDHDLAAALAGLGVPAFACTPDAFPDLMAAAIERRDLTDWASGYFQHSVSK